MLKTGRVEEGVMVGSVPHWLIGLWAANLVIATTIASTSRNSPEAMKFCGPIGWFFIALFGIPGYIVYALGRAGSLDFEAKQQRRDAERRSEEHRRHLWWQATGRDPWVFHTQTGRNAPVWYDYPPGLPSDYPGGVYPGLP